MHRIYFCNLTSSTVPVTTVTGTSSCNFLNSQPWAPKIVIWIPHYCNKREHDTQNNLIHSKGKQRIFVSTLTIFLKDLLNRKSESYGFVMDAVIVGLMVCCLEKLMKQTLISKTLT